MQEKTEIKVQSPVAATEAGKPGIRVIDTNLIGKSEVFKLLALAEALKLPVLLVGQPGTAKTACVISYAEGYYGNSHAEAMKHTFILETDEGTKPAEVKGFPDMQKLLVENKFEKYAPIAEADFIVINEVDKAAGGLRNALLGVMNEKIVFNGKDKVPCRWNTFVATCNEIPKEEEGNPFWDRFVLKMEVSRMTASEMMSYFNKGDKTYHQEIKVKIPTLEEIQKIEISEKKLEIFLSKTREHCTDRTLSFVPRLAKAASIVYNCSVDKALIKIAEIVAGRTVANELAKVLHTPEMKSIMDAASLIPGITDPDQLNETIEKINTMIEKFYNNKKISADDINEVQKYLTEVTKDHPIAQEIVFEEVAD